MMKAHTILIERNYNFSTFSSQSDSMNNQNSCTTENCEKQNKDQKEQGDAILNHQIILEYR